MFKYYNDRLSKSSLVVLVYFHSINRSELSSHNVANNYLLPLSDTEDKLSCLAYRLGVGGWGEHWFKPDRSRE